MSVYSDRIGKLKKEIKLITTKKKKLNKNQKVMIKFINGINSNAIFEVNGKKIILSKGSKTRGFQHIIEKHYCKGCPGELSTMDILNIADVAIKGITLANEGVSTPDLKVKKLQKSQNDYRLVMKEIDTDNLVITYYTID